MMSEDNSETTPNINAFAGVFSALTDPNNGLINSDISSALPSLLGENSLLSNNNNNSTTSPSAGGKIRVPKRFQCRFCSHTSNRKNELEDHERKHQDKMCFQCHMCDYKAKQIVTMKATITRSME